jgi:hypothetical protein
MIMARFNSPQPVQRFLSPFVIRSPTFSPPGRDNVIKFRGTRSQAFTKMGRGHRRSDGCVIEPVDSRHSAHHAFGSSSDGKLTVPFVPRTRAISVNNIPGCVYRVPKA